MIEDYRILLDYVMWMAADRRTDEQLKEASDAPSTDGWIAYAVLRAREALSKVP